MNMGTHSVRVLVSLCAMLLAVPAAGSEADEATLETLVSALQTSR
jgi:hypothetical protein